MFENVEYKHPLIIGTGGGNDIVSASLVLAALARNNISADIAGMCSPGALHFYEGKSEEPINLVSNRIERYFPTKQPTKISFIDAKIPHLLKNEGLNARVYNLSLAHGTSKLIGGLENLVAQNGYDGVIAVDVGGDILARAGKDNTILSPLMDFSCLYAVSQLSIPSILVEFGLQTDGELRPDGCEQIFQEFKEKNLILDTTKMYKANLPVQVYKRVFDGIKAIRAGHTATMTFQTLEADADIKTEYRSAVRVLEKRVSHSFPITLESKYFGKIWTLKLKELAASRELAFKYENTLELYLKTKRIMDTKTEMDLSYSQEGGNNLWLGLLCPQIKGFDRINLLNYGLDNLDFHADTALLWKTDAKNLRLKKFVEECEDFIVTGDINEQVSKSVDSVRSALG